MQLNVSPEIGDVLEKAAAISANQGSYFVGVNQVLTALLESAGQFPEGVRERHLSDLFSVQREVNRMAWAGNASTPSGETFYTPRCIQLISQASKLATRIGHGKPPAGHLLLALLRDDLSAPARAMDRLGLDRAACNQQLQAELGFVSPQAYHKVTPLPDYSEVQLQNIPAAKGARSASAAVGASPSSPMPRDEVVPLPNQSGPLTRDLTEAAHRGALQEATGRDDEMFEVLQILSRKTKNNVMLVGEAGVGKTQIVEGLALRIAKEGKSGGLPPFRILELNIAALMTGTQYRGAFEEKVLALIEQVKRSDHAVLFIDEVHLIMGAGATDGDGMDLANLLKPELSRGEFRCIGATTLQEYRKFVEKDPAVERRFQMVRVDELSAEASYEVLKRVRPTLEKHHGVHIHRRTLKAAIDLTVRYMPNRNLPDKAIDVLDQACARHRLRSLMMRKKDLRESDNPDTDGERSVTPHSIRKVVSQITAIPLEQLTADERMYLNNLDQVLKKQLIGQDEAVNRAVSAVKKSRTGLSDPNRPDSIMLFLGPTGVGKTQLAKLLAQHLFGSSSHLIVFDMSEYSEEHSIAKLIGAPPGYVGHEEEGVLTGAVKNAPFSILLFDEIEKAHSRIFDLFLPMFDEGRLRDSRGREVSFKNCIIIITSNIGSDLLLQAEAAVAQEALIQALRDHFRPEFVNRLDQVVPFYPLLSEDVRNILRLEVNAIRNRLQEKQIGIRMYQRAYEYIAREGYSREYGARELRRAVDRFVTTPISDGLIDGRFESGDMIDILLEDDDTLIYRKGKPGQQHAEDRAMSQPDMLEVINGPEDGTEFPINRAPLIIGSDMSCEVNIRLDEAVQRYHARLTAVGDGYRVRKIHGGNLAVNGKSTGVIRSRVLREGSVLTVGNTEFYLRCAPDGLARRSRGLPVENDVVWSIRVLARKLWAAAWWVGTLSGGTSRFVRGLVILFVLAVVAGYFRPGLPGEIQYFVQRGIASIQELLAPFLNGPN